MEYQYRKNNSTWMKWIKDLTVIDYTGYFNLNGVTQEIISMADYYPKVQINPYKERDIYNNNN